MQPPAGRTLSGDRAEAGDGLGKAVVARPGRVRLQHGELGQCLVREVAGESAQDLGRTGVADTIEVGAERGAIWHSRLGGESLHRRVEEGPRGVGAARGVQGQGGGEQRLRLAGWRAEQRLGVDRGGLACGPGQRGRMRAWSEISAGSIDAISGAAWSERPVSRSRDGQVPPLLALGDRLGELPERADHARERRRRRAGSDGVATARAEDLDQPGDLPGVGIAVDERGSLGDAALVEHELEQLEPGDEPAAPEPEAGQPALCGAQVAARQREPHAGHLRGGADRLALGGCGDGRIHASQSFDRGLHVAGLQRPVEVEAGEPGGACGGLGAARQGRGEPVGARRIDAHQHVGPPAQGGVGDAGRGGVDRGQVLAGRAEARQPPVAEEHDPRDLGVGVGAGDGAGGDARAQVEERSILAEERIAHRHDTRDGDGVARVERGAADALDGAGPVATRTRPRPGS